MDVGSASASSANRPAAKKLQQQDSDDPSQYDEEYVLLQIPDFDKTKFCEGVTNIDVSKIDSKTPEIVLDKQFHYEGKHGDAMGTLLHLQGDQYLGKGTKVIKFRMKREQDKSIAPVK